MGYRYTAPGGASIAQVISVANRPLRSGGTVYYSGQFAGGSNLVLVQNTLYAMPFFVPTPTTFSKIGVISPGVALSSARLGIYADTGGVPAALILDAGSVATTASAFVTITISQLLPAGWCWLACAVQGAAGNLYSSGTNATVNPVGTTAPFTSGPPVGYTQPGISGALPAPWGSTLTESGNIVVVWVAPA